jgi:hypothetical protein
MGTLSHLNPKTLNPNPSPALRVCAECLAQFSNSLLRIFTADVLQQCLCLCGVVTLLTQHLLTFPLHYIRPAEPFSCVLHFTKASCR